MIHKKVEMKFTHCMLLIGLYPSGKVQPVWPLPSLDPALHFAPPFTWPSLAGANGSTTPQNSPACSAAGLAQPGANNGMRVPAPGSGYGSVEQAAGALLVAKILGCFQVGHAAGQDMDRCVAIRVK